MTLYEELINLGEYYLAGYAKNIKKSRNEKVAKAIECHFIHSPLPEHKDNAFYPEGKFSFYATGESLGLYTYCQGLLGMDMAKFESTYASVSDENKEAFEKLYQDLVYYAPGQVCNKENGTGGLSWTHSTINFDRIIREGLDSYLDRILKNQEKNPPFYNALKTTYSAIKILHKRIIKQLKSANNPDKRLIKAFMQVPFKPARDFYEALVCINFMYYIDDCDNLGRLDQYLYPYLKDTSDQVAIELLKDLWSNIDTTDGFHVTVGGINQKGEDGTNRLTHLILKSAKNFRRPQISFLYKETESDETKRLILEDWQTGSGQPALYNNKLFLQNYAGKLKVAKKYLWRMWVGGCTEHNINGMSNTGSTSCGLQNLLIFERCMYAFLEECSDYEEFYNRFITDTKVCLLKATAEVSLDMELKAKYVALPVRSLLVDDCIDKGLDYQSGGARYNAASMGFGGTSNVANSLYTLKKLGFGKKYTNKEIIDACKNDFVGYEKLLADINRLPKFGQDCDEVDEIYADYLKQCTELVLKQQGTRGDYCPWGCTFNLFVTYAGFGKNVGATPDGRRYKAPLGDSIGATQGDDTEGPTALIKSVTKLPLPNFITVPVFNIRINKSSLSVKKERDNIVAMIDTFFKLDGMQMQATVADQKELLDALKHPEKHKNLIVRIGGYSEYFNNLDDDLKREVIKRVQHF